MPKRASASVQAVLPSAALGLIEKPSGRVTVAARISEGEGDGGARLLGDAEVDFEPRGRVGRGGGRLGVEAGVEAELVAAGGGGPGRFGVGDAAVVGEDFEGGAERNAAGGRVVEEGDVRGCWRGRALAFAVAHRGRSRPAQSVACRGWSRPGPPRGRGWIGEREGVAQCP